MKFEHGKKFMWDCKLYGTYTIAWRRKVTYSNIIKHFLRIERNNIRVPASNNIEKGLITVFTYAHVDHVCIIWEINAAESMIGLHEEKQTRGTTSLSHS